MQSLNPIRLYGPVELLCCLRTLRVRLNGILIRALRSEFRVKFGEMGAKTLVENMAAYGANIFPKIVKTRLYENPKINGNSVKTSNLYP